MSMRMQTSPGRAIIMPFRRISFKRIVLSELFLSDEFRVEYGRESRLNGQMAETLKYFKRLNPETGCCMARSARHLQSL